MFELTPETKAEIAALLRERLDLHYEDHYTDDHLIEVIDEVVTVVKRQFGM